MSFKVLFDANVLVPAGLNDIVLTLASAEMYQPLWSKEILREVERTLVNRINLSPESVHKRITAMNDGFPEASVENYEGLINGIDCTDSKDRHVLAAAIAGGAGALVTFNLKDFPVDLFEQHGIDIEHPDEFLAGQFDLDAAICSKRIALLLKRWKQAPQSVPELIIEYNESLPEFCEELNKNRAAIEFHLSLMN